MDEVPGPLVTEKNQKQEKIASIFKNCLISRNQKLEKQLITSINYAVTYYQTLE